MNPIVWLMNVRMLLAHTEVAVRDKSIALRERHAQRGEPQS